MTAGYIYVLSNPSFGQNIFKVGKTRFDPSKRAFDLSNTSLPTPFQVEYSSQVQNVGAIELIVHNKLKQHRINESREFFKTDLSTITSAIIDATSRENSINDLHNNFDIVSFIPALTGAAFKVLFAMKYYSELGACKLSFRELADITGLKSQAITKAVSDLAGMKLITPIGSQWNRAYLVSQ